MCKSRTAGSPSLVPTHTHTQLLSLAAQKKNQGKAWKDLSRDACCCWLHVLSAHIWICSLPFSLLSLNSVRFRSVCPASPIATGSIVANYSKWHQQWHAARHKSFQAFPPFFVHCNRQKLGVEAWERGYGSPGSVKMQTRKRMVIVCWMHFWFWKIACQRVFSTTSASCWIT